MHKDFTPKDVIDLVKKEGVKFIDYRFMDFPGMMQHFGTPAAELTEDTFEDGLGFDGSKVIRAAVADGSGDRRTGATVPADDSCRRR